MAWNSLPCNVFKRVFVYLSSQDIAFRTCVLNQAWHQSSLIHLYNVIPPFASASQLARACQSMISHPEKIAQSVYKISIVHPIQDIDQHSMLYYTVRAALALCTNLETLCLHTEPSLARVLLGASSFRLKTFSIIDPSDDLPTVFLSYQERLQELVVVRGATIPLYLPKDVLPNLVSFSGIPENVVRISQGRRLRTIRILPGPVPLNLADTLSRIDPLSIFSLSSLHILVTGSVLYHVTVIGQFLPRLTTLVVRYYQREILYGILGGTLSTFTNLREFSMFSLNQQVPMTLLALNSENVIVRFFHKHCPTLQSITLRYLSWICADNQDPCWCPHVGDGLHIEQMWKDTRQRDPITVRTAEDTIWHYEGGIDGELRKYVTSMEVDTISEASDYGDQLNYISADEFQEGAKTA